MNIKTDFKWLESWEENIIEKSILELGAGDGRDSAYLRDHSYSLISTDLKPNEDLMISFMDHSKPLSFEDDSFDVVVASLTLHYFTWSQTTGIVKELKRILKNGGLLICRVNSIKDTNYGASGYPEVEPGVYQVNDQLKRFFAKKDVIKLFCQGWKVKRIEEKLIDRYMYPKAVWEFGAVTA
jgi:ubiquinone/menaquinone biosynthesis C-methylase UbiE